MITRLEVWDFECHEHSVLENFTPGLNLIFGASDSGKTSLVRAFKLVAYNDFDPRSVRTGCKNCKVRVDTEHGYVMVTKGKDNIWEVGKVGQKPQHFEKIGKRVLPEVSEILGLQMVDIGDVALSVNIMDQAESHFMLNELGGKDASGSTRAQIVDEISGLSGIEGIIKDVSLDRHRLGRQVKEHEDRAAEFRESMHDVDVLKREQNTLQNVKESLLIHQANNEKMERLADLLEEHHKLSTEVDELQGEMDTLPDIEQVKDILKKTTEDVSFQPTMQELHEEHQRTTRQIEDTDQELSTIPDISVVVSILKDVEVSCKRAGSLVTMKNEHEGLEAEVFEAESQYSKLPKVTAVMGSIKQAEKALKAHDRALAEGQLISDELEEQDELEREMEACEFMEKEATEERDLIQSQVTVCPLTLAPISKACKGE